ncbi:DUF6516 family protein [Moorella naiadis]|uniref:toxin-antitoxin system TumE family protein n=1 Tax=Moorella naiadis (nom. illeg.) TaxID=3093670 RepID=UPI003D9C9590
MIQEYFDFLKKIASTFAFTKDLRVVKEVTGINRGFIRFVIQFLDGSELHVFEHVNINLHKTDYAYHWQDANYNLIARWDNAAHHPEIKTHPHHYHEKEKVNPSSEPNLTDILRKISERYLNR